MSHTEEYNNFLEKLEEESKSQGKVISCQSPDSIIKDEKLRYILWWVTVSICVAVIIILLTLVFWELLTPQSSEIIGRVITINPTQISSSSNNINKNNDEDPFKYSVTALVYPIDKVLYQPNYEAQSYEESRERGKYIYIVCLYVKEEDKWLTFNFKNKSGSNENGDENENWSEKNENEKLYLSLTSSASLATRFIFTPVWGYANLYTIWTLQGPWLHEVDCDQEGWYTNSCNKKANNDDSTTTTTCSVFEKSGQIKVVRTLSSYKIFKVLTESEYKKQFKEKEKEKQLDKKAN